MKWHYFSDHGRSHRSGSRGHCDRLSASKLHREKNRLPAEGNGKPDEQGPDDSVHHLDSTSDYL